ncbi:Fpg/Nei family DNA glycosylase [Parenemella sanctibonifatiensis]|uniref:Endonuclease VIII n=1 Tax=Parenemella sanctibonifatiensis TaxID=2016505 RepID=A0A255E9L3_9ACTN|nr:DNA-formamidopyrimidine glycosylase family protein [Parenemella sanctibonifatiensis]OYN88249.1 endonuclease VIII [Parenemella sanctibonifatiensis]OYN89917.1 endonuclease VIII [Parenemella sanctibonifatiensis]
MPELPEVEGLAEFLRGRLVGSSVAAVEVGSINVLKTYDPQPTALNGLEITAVRRHGKWLDVDADGLHLVWHLSRAGWVRWSESLNPKPLRPSGKAVVALRVRIDDGEAPEDGLPGFELTEAGTTKRLAVHVVADSTTIPQIASLGPDPLAPDFDRAALAGILAGRNQQLKGVLRDQSVIAGIGNAYSDEILHAAQLSPFAIASRLEEEQLDRLDRALHDVLDKAVAVASGKPAKELKDAKRRGMAVHGRTGETCPVCGDVVREVSFADSSLQYCATCQTGGKPLADRRTSKFLK